MCVPACSRMSAMTYLATKRQNNNDQRTTTKKKLKLAFHCHWHKTRTNDAIGIPTAIRCAAVPSTLHCALSLQLKEFPLSHVLHSCSTELCESCQMFVCLSVYGQLSLQSLCHCSMFANGSSDNQHRGTVMNSVRNLLWPGASTFIHTTIVSSNSNDSTNWWLRQCPNSIWCNIPGSFWNQSHWQVHSAHTNRITLTVIRWGCQLHFYSYRNSNSRRRLGLWMNWAMRLYATKLHTFFFAVIFKFRHSWTTQRNDKQN